MVDPGELVTATLRREFGEEALNSLEEVSDSGKNAMEGKIEEFFRRGIEVKYEIIRFEWVIALILLSLGAAKLYFINVFY